MLGYLAYAAMASSRPGWAWLLGAMAALYNPFLRVHLDRDTWTVANMATIAILVFATLNHIPSTKTRS
jgi:hypothetical protein